VSQAHLDFIGGKWVPSEGGATFRVTNPADTGQDLGEFQLSTKEDARKAVESARLSAPAWRNTPAPQRGKILYKAAEIIESKVDEFARTLTMEEGKTLADSVGEVRRTVDLLRFYGGQGSRLDGKTYPSNFPRTLLYSVREPVGVVVLMTPWNFPIAIPAWKMAPALVSGNSVVFKPASLTPGIATKLVSALEQAGLPPGVLNLVTGPGSTVGEELALNRDVDAISFTGSYEVGEGIQRARANSGKMARIQLEMGGKNPTIVLPDAKLEDAVDVVAKSAFGLTGQACTATSRVMVHEMGPAVSRSELEKDIGYVDIGQAEGARLIAGGGRIQDQASTGYFMQPTIFDNVFADMKIAKEEIFGPVLSLFEVKSVDEAVELANRSEFGLTACICTSNLASALEFADRVQAGVVKVNRPTVGLELQVPFGGIKKSSSDSFKEQGEEGIDFYTRIKTVYMGY
jgi:aldehyde dehydrogenase (NAD+)